ncbi:MAG TPA: serine/threonine-protein kinase [Acidimicrobiales bacterium]|nr:serine/threonine-protein kinase [Acidimicrobiales bacterium]
MTIASDAFVVDGRYEVGELLGRGGMGEVRRAHDLRLKRDVAIKFLRPDLAAQPEARRRFEEEAHNAARLSHPNVVLVLDSGEHEGRPYLVMECLPGHTLRDEFADGPLSESRVTWIARDVLAALVAAHDVGVMHRDVSPSNILLTDAGRAKLADFGIAKAMESADDPVTAVGLVVGTPGYMAPERLRGEPATAASDIYALGATLRQALGGAAASAELEGVLNAMTAGDPRQRPPAITALAAFDGIEGVDDVEGVGGDDGDDGGATAAIPVLTESLPEGRTETIAVETAAAPAAMTMALPAVAARHTAWRDRSTRLAIVAVAALLGALLLFAALVDTDGGGDHPASTNEGTTPAPTVTVPATTTIPAPAPAPKPSVRVDLGGGGGRPSGKGKGRGKN